MSNVILFRVAPETAAWLFEAIAKGGSPDEGSLAPARWDDEEAVLARLASPRDPVDVLVVGPGVDAAALVRKARAIAPELSVVRLGGPEGGGAPRSLPASDCRALLCVLEAEVARVRAGRASAHALNEETRRRLEAEARLEAAEDELLQVRARESATLGRIAHDVRAPLTVILGAVAELSHPAVGVMNEDQTALVALVRRGAERLRQLASTLTDAPSAEERVELTRRHTDLAALVRGAVQRARQEVASETVAIECEAPPGPVDVVADVEKIALLMNHLLTSAVRLARGEVRVRVAKSGPLARVELDADDASKSEPEEGAAAVSRGIGPALVRSIVLAHGGTVKTENVSVDGVRSRRRTIVSFPAHPVADLAPVH